MNERDYPTSPNALGKFAEYQAGALMRAQNATLRENIDAQIVGLQKQVAELEATKDRMQKSGILDMRIDDIQRAMRF